MQAANVLRAWERPVVLKEKSKKKKKKRKYSRKWKDVQKLERSMTKSSRRFSKALLKGTKTYVKRRDKSSRKKKDGAIKDLMKNTTRAFSKTVGKSTPEVFNLAKAGFKYSTGKSMQRTLRRFAKGSISFL